MKKISLFIFILLTFVLCSLEMKSQSDCYNTGSQCGPWSTTWMGVVYSLPGHDEFKTCTLTVEVKTRVCRFQNRSQTQVWCSGI